MGDLVARPDISWKRGGSIPEKNQLIRGAGPCHGRLPSVSRLVLRSRTGVVLCSIGVVPSGME